jgi:hypothetical protein
VLSEVRQAKTRLEWRRRSVERRAYGVPPKILSLIALPPISAGMTPVVIIRTVAWTAVRLNA